MELNFHYQIMVAHTDFQKKVLNRLRKAGLTAGQPKVLDYLKDHNGANQKAIAQGCHMEPASVSSVLAGMEHAGLISRQAEPGDRRSLRVYLTPLGEEKSRLTQQVFGELEAQALRGIRDTQRRELIALLVQVAENLKDEKGETE